MAGRVARDSGGAAVVLAQAPSTDFSRRRPSLVTSWSGLIQEPPRTGTDDRGVAYTDYNYSSLCGAGRRRRDPLLLARIDRGRDREGRLLHRARRLGRRPTTPRPTGRPRGRTATGAA